MRQSDLARDASKFLSELQAKQYRQVAQKVFGLLSDPQPNDASQLKESAY